MSEENGHKVSGKSETPFSGSTIDEQHDIGVTSKKTKFIQVYYLWTDQYKSSESLVKFAGINLNIFVVISKKIDYTFPDTQLSAKEFSTPYGLQSTAMSRGISLSRCIVDRKFLPLPLYISYPLPFSKFCSTSQVFLLPCFFG